jgi:hypothetical protein
MKAQRLAHSIATGFFTFAFQSQRPAELAYINSFGSKASAKNATVSPIVMQTTISPGCSQESLRMAVGSLQKHRVTIRIDTGCSFVEPATEQHRDLASC